MSKDAVIGVDKLVICNNNLNKEVAITDIETVSFGSYMNLTQIKPICLSEPKNIADVLISQQKLNIEIHSIILDENEQKSLQISLFENLIFEKYSLEIDKKSGIKKWILNIEFKEEEVKNL